MAFSEKTNNDGTKSLGPTSPRLPDRFPSVPNEMKDRFPEMKEFDDDLQSFWFSLKTTLVEDFDKLKEQIDDIV